MATDHQHHDHHAHHGPRALPSVLAAPEGVAGLRTKALVIGLLFTVLSLVFLFVPTGRGHLLRAYAMGYMTIFNFCGGALALLMVQYVSGGKWGLILRRPLEAMTRTFPLVAIGVVPLLITPLSKHLYQWQAFHTPQQTWDAYRAGLISQEQELCINLKHTMLSPVSAVVQAILVLGFMGLVISLLNKWSRQRDEDPTRGTIESFDKWRVKFENLSGPSILLYVILLTDFIIVFLKSMDVTWYSTIFGLRLLVNQGYAVLALGILTLILLSRFEPMKSMFRITEQHDMGKLAFAFVMLNIYFTFAEFLIIWSGNLPDEIPWYLHRIRGGWWTICSLDVICHWIIPFCILLSRDFKRSRSRMIGLCVFMLFARLLDMFWLVEPNFNDAMGNLHLAGNFGILAYITVPLGMVALWGAYYLFQLGQRPLINLNDPHTEEVLEPEHAH
jgi:hypothetical protein